MDRYFPGAHGDYPDHPPPGCTDEYHSDEYSQENYDNSNNGSLDYEAIFFNIETRCQTLGQFRTVFFSHKKPVSGEIKQLIDDVSRITIYEPIISKMFS